jgi:beta-glucanase (GH16 family)
MRLSILVLSVMITATCLHAAEWQLVWSDEFDYKGLPDSTKWDYEEGFVRNLEMQYYTRAQKKNTRVEKGVLVIEGRKEQILNPKYKAGSDSWIEKREFGYYTSASLITKNKASWTYGRIEVRAKLPHGKGVWPAIWTLGANRAKVPWPASGEIDIMEFVGKDPNRVHATVHCGADGKPRSQGGKFQTEQPWADFHVYAIEWYHDRIDFYFDDHKYFTYSMDDAGKGEDNPFRKPQYLLINLALGGGWAGDIDDSILPQKYLIDYVRVYQLNETENLNKFETIRAYIQTWLSHTDTDKAIISSSYLKEKIIDDWANQKDKYQIVSVRKLDDYNNAGHIPHAINIYWIDLLNDSSIAQLDPNKTQILYCYYGHASMLSYTILSLLGYRCQSLDFGMMDWNLDALAKEPWDQQADYEIETTVNLPKETYPLPTMTSDQNDIKSLIKEMATKYFAGEGSPIIASSDVKAIIDDWEHKKTEYQVVSVISRKDYETGHIPHAINISLEKIAELNNLKKLDPNRTTIVYSDNGQTGQLAATVLNLLSYKAAALKFGMMDWNKSYVNKSHQWDGTATYPFEKGN